MYFKTCEVWGSVKGVRSGWEVKPHYEDQIQIPLDLDAFSIDRFP